MATPPLPDDAARLAALSPSRATPLLLAMARAQAARRRPADLLRQMARDGYVQPAAVDQRLLHRLDGVALDAAPHHPAVALSPVAPLGACSVVGPTSQDRTLSAARGAEVVSDPTNVLALRCAEALAADPRRDVRFCTVHQVLRAQPLPPGKGFTRHFRLFCVVDAGPGRPDDGFEVDAVARHVALFDRLFDGCAAVGARFPDRAARVLTTEDVLGDRVAAALRAALPHVEVQRGPLDAAYYGGLRVMFGARATDGTWLPIGDTGRFDWVAQLTSDARQRFVASGLGLQLIPFRFVPQAG